jgi:plasmid stability protein
MKRITVDLPEELYERLRLAAYTEHRSVSEVVRDRLTASLPALPAAEA